MTLRRIQLADTTAQSVRAYRGPYRCGSLLDSLCAAAGIYQAFEVLGLVECGGFDTARLCAVRVCAVWVPTPVPSVGAGTGGGWGKNFDRVLRWFVILEFVCGPGSRSTNHVRVSKVTQKTPTLLSIVHHEHVHDSIVAGALSIELQKTTENGRAVDTSGSSLIKNLSCFWRSGFAPCTP